jgi:hypothetical protein
MIIDPTFGTVVVREQGDSQSFQAALFIGLGAVVAAIVTAVAAQLRLRATLRGERQRLGDQLSHDREMNDLDDLRERFDSASEIAENALDSIHEALANLLSADRDKDTIEKLLDRAETDVIELALHVQRGWNRLGFESELPSALEKWRLALGEYHSFVQEAAENNEAPEGKQVNEKISEAASAYREFSTAFYTLIGTRLDPRLQRFV